jgi:hypothetical protein
MRPDPAEPCCQSSQCTQPEPGNPTPGMERFSSPLERAKFLGYLRAVKPTGPTVEAYESWCHRHGRPMILLHTARDGSSTIIYRLPDFRRALAPGAVDLIRRKVAHGLCPGTTRRPLISRSGGQINGLESKGAEAIAFWIADAALDPDQTIPLRV